MSLVQEQFGVVGDLPSQAEEFNYPKRVPGRVAHIDSDFLAHQVAAITVAEKDGTIPRRSLEDMKSAVQAGLRDQMLRVGAETYIAHITPKGSTKGGRAEMAVTKPYQANRNNREVPGELRLIHEYIKECLPSVAHMDQEADDGMAQANVAAIDRGERELSVILSKDKDLRMVPGLHYDYDTETVIDVEDPFGSIWIDRTKSAATLKGWGTKFFWAQCLMGDTADNIAGLPSIPPTGKSTKPKTVGPVAAFKFLEDADTDRECFEIAKYLYASSTHEWLHHATQEPCRWAEALVGDMRTLWMRRYKTEYDLHNWMIDNLGNNTDEQSN